MKIQEKTFTAKIAQDLEPFYHIYRPTLSPWDREPCRGDFWKWVCAESFSGKGCTHSTLRARASSWRAWGHCWSTGPWRTTCTDFSRRPAWSDNYRKSALKKRGKSLFKIWIEVVSSLSFFSRYGQTVNLFQIWIEVATSLLFYWRYEMI